MAHTRCENSCCGLYEFHGLNSLTNPDRVNESTREIVNLTRINDRNNGSIAVFATATDDQLNNRNIRETLDRLGFKIVTRWLNANSGNMCNLLIKSNQEHTEWDNLPPEYRGMVKGGLLDQPAEAAEDPEPIPEPRYRHVLYRIRFDEDGLVNRRIEIAFFPEEPTQDNVRHAISRYKAATRGNSDRWRFDVVKEEIID